jgi:hypothetical protein
MRTVLVISLVLAPLAGCRPHSAPTGPGAEPATDSAGPTGPARTYRRPAREVAIGELCPEAAGGRPAVMTVFLRKLAWVEAPGEVSAAVREASIRQFSVYDWAGARAGLFSVAASAEVGLDRPAAIGAYAGHPPCQLAPDAPPDPICVAAQEQCGVAVGVIEPSGGFESRPFGEDPEPVELETSAACVAEGMLVVDIDGDGEREAYPASQFLGPVRMPADEVIARPRGKASCKPAFALRHVLPPANPKHWRGLDLLGVIDLDADGRYELIMSYHYSDRRTWAIYSAAGRAGRLELVGESTPWPRP